MSIAPRQGTCPHHQAYWLSAKKTPSIEKVFLITSHQLVLLNDQYKKKLPFLYSICAASTVFLKTSLSLSRAALSRQIAPRFCYSRALLLALLWCAVDSKRAWSQRFDRPIVRVVSDSSAVALLLPLQPTWSWDESNKKKKKNEIYPPQKFFLLSKRIFGSCRELVEVPRLLACRDKVGLPRDCQVLS